VLCGRRHVIQEVVVRLACNGIDSTPIRERASIDAIPEFECNFYNAYRVRHAHSNIEKGRTKATLAREINVRSVDQ
jgi:hypothetical protein